MGHRHSLLWDIPIAPRSDPNGPHAGKPRKEKNNIETKTNSNDMKRIPATTVLCLCTLLLSACSNEDFPEQVEGEKPCDYICFGISPDESAQAKGSVQAKAKEYTSDRFVLRSADSADTLCVRTIVSEGIQGATSTDKAITRGMPVDQTNFYKTFNVVATMDNGFYMNTTAEKQDNLYETTDGTYYWPDGKNLDFYAWAPTDDKGTGFPALSQDATPEALKTLAYTVPDDAAKQKDLVVASNTEATAGQSVGLTFNHICTAVKFVVGEQMQPGTIKSVSLEGVKYTGSYDMTTGQWSLTNDTKSFTQELNKDMTGGETENTEITATEGTFMMLPQILPDGAKVKVEFSDNVAGKDRTLEASIAGSDWPMGKTVTYKLTITPDYDMSITCERDQVDAHVDIEQITIEADGPWVLSSDVNWLTFTDWSYDTSKPEERPLGHRGYWIRSERGEKTFSGSGNMTLYAYYDENLTDANRTANITLTYPGTSIAGAQKTVTQYCPAWIGNAGYERFEEDHRWEEDGSKTFTYPFGFAWDRKVTFTAAPKFTGDPSLRDVFGAIVFESIANNMISQYDASAYVTVEIDYFLWVIPIKTTVTIDYSNFNAIGDLVTSDDGLTNTRNLYGFKNIGQVSAIENILRDNAVGDFTENVINDSHGNIPVDQFAARRIAMKNEFQKELREETVEGETIRYYEAVIDVNSIHWYLPASNEQVSLKAGLTEGDEPLEGEYWSSTAVNDNTNAYKYTPDGTLNSEDRMVPHKMRAAVRKSN